MLYTLLIILFKEILAKKNDIEQGLDNTLTIVIQYPSQDEVDELV